MNEIYKIVANLRSQFETMTYGLTTDKNEVDEVVQELMIYMLQMNPDTLKGIYEKDGEKGIIKYGAVVIRRSLQSKYSPYYYKYKKYYTKLDDSCNISYESISEIIPSKYLYNLPNEEQNYQWFKLEEIDLILDQMYWYDRELFKMYYHEGNTLDGLAKKTGISRNSLFTTIDNVRKLLKDKLND